MELTLIIDIIILVMIGLMAYSMLLNRLNNPKCPKCKSLMHELKYNQDKEYLNVNCIECGYNYTIKCYDKK